MKPTIQQSPRDRHGKLKTVAQILFLIFLIAGTVWILVRHSNENCRQAKDLSMVLSIRYSIYISNPLIR